MLASLEDLKGKLDIPATDLSRDSALLLVLESASEKVLDVCRYSETAITARQEIFRNVQYNRDLFTALRPIDPGVAAVFEGRPLGQGADGTQPAWSKLEGDVIDAAEGRFTLLGASGWWPPTQRGLQPNYQRWRDPEWPIIRVTYNVTALAPPPDELVDACASLAAFWFDRDLAGAGSVSQIGQVRREWLNDALPATFTARLSSHISVGAGAQWV